MADIAFSRPDLHALSLWFKANPNLRPFPCGATQRLRTLFAKIEVRFHLGKLSPVQLQLISEYAIPVGLGTLLSVSEEHALLRNVALIEALRDGHNRLPRTYSAGFPAALRKWVMRMRALRERAPFAIEVRLIERLVPDFPWRDGLSFARLRALAFGLSLPEPRAVRVPERFAAAHPADPAGASE